VVCATIGSLAEKPALVYWTEKADETCRTQVPDLHWIRVPDPRHSKPWKG
jgi:hypothetical protein